MAVLAAYLVGAIPTGYLIVRLLYGLDVRQIGSGRTGGTNALRAGGTRVGIYTATGDITKGWRQSWWRAPSLDHLRRWTRWPGWRLSLGTIGRCTWAFKAERALRPIWVWQLRCGRRRAGTRCRCCRWVCT